MSNGGTVIEVEAQINALRAAQRAFQVELQNAEQLEVEAMAAEQLARDAQAKARKVVVDCRAAIREYAEELDVLITEWMLLPRQRRPVD